MSNAPTLAIIGAGPKAAAIAAKAFVLKQVGLPTPQIFIIEKSKPAAHWHGNHGYTDGTLRLGTSPEKDTGFPYDTHQFSAEINDQINQHMQQFSWHAFLVGKHGYAQWIDRNRPAPTHQEWAAYLTWVLEKTSEVYTYIKSEVTGLTFTDEGWTLHYNQSDRLSVDHLLLTGTGQPKTQFNIPTHEHILTLENIWESTLINDKPNPKIAIIGAGESAASLALYLLEKRHFSGHIDIINPFGLLFSRGEHFTENQVYSSNNTQAWQLRDLKERKDFMMRTDLGVVSQSIAQALGHYNEYQVLRGWVEDIHIDNNKPHIMLKNQANTLAYDFVVIATGFDLSAQLQKWCDAKTLNHLKNTLNCDTLDYQKMALHVTHDLSLSGLKNKLFIPQLAGIMQGPGFSNLSCLGYLSDRILNGVMQHATSN